MLRGVRHGVRRCHDGDSLMPTVTCDGCGRDTCVSGKQFHQQPDRLHLCRRCGGLGVSQISDAVDRKQLPPARHGMTEDSYSENSDADSVADDDDWGTSPDIILKFGQRQRRNR